MQKVESTEELQQIKKLGNTVYLRKNISQKTIENEDGSKETLYVADEVWFEKENSDLQHIHDNFELYWEWANEKREKEKTMKEKKNLVNKLIDKKYDLADLKETVDQLVKDNLS